VTRTPLCAPLRPWDNLAAQATAIGTAVPGAPSNGPLTREAAGHAERAPGTPRTAALSTALWTLASTNSGANATAPARRERRYRVVVPPARVNDPAAGDDEVGGGAEPYADGRARRRSRTWSAAVTEDTTWHEVPLGHWPGCVAHSPHH